MWDAAKGNMATLPSYAQCGLIMDDLQRCCDLLAKEPAPPLLGAARCYATFELANQETVTPCHLQHGHEGDHEGWCLGSKAHWPHGFISEYEFRRALDAEIVRTKIEMIELEKDLSHNDGTQRPGDAEATNATRATPPGSLE
jgi:hypothetical protein